MRLPLLLLAVAAGAAPTPPAKPPPCPSLYQEARGGEVLVAGPGLHYQNYLPSIPPK